MRFPSARFSWLLKTDLILGATQDLAYSKLVNNNNGSNKVNHDLIPYFHHTVDFKDSSVG